MVDETKISCITVVKRISLELRKNLVANLSMENLEFAIGRIFQRSNEHEFCIYIIVLAWKF